MSSGAWMAIGIAAAVLIALVLWSIDRLGDALRKYEERRRDYDE